MRPLVTSSRPGSTSDFRIPVSVQFALTYHPTCLAPEGGRCSVDLPNSRCLAVCHATSPVREGRSTYEVSSSAPLGLLATSSFTYGRNSVGDGQGKQRLSGVKHKVGWDGGPIDSIVNGQSVYSIPRQAEIDPWTVVGAYLVSPWGIERMR